MDRIELGEVEHRDGFRALPFNWHKELQLRSYPRFQDILRGIRDWMAERLDSLQRRWFGSEMFRVVAGKFDQPVVAVLEESIDSGSLKQIEAVAAILREAPKDLAWDNIPFVGRLLKGAARHGDEFAEKIGSALLARMTSGTRSGTPGQPFPEDVELRDKSARIAQTLAPGSLEERFYRSIQQAAEANIQWDRDRDEKLTDGRDW